jgi:hypothetical protein
MAATPAAIDRSTKAIPFPIPAPVGGLNARDALAAMPPTDASVLTNYFPYADRVETRPGFSVQATATPVDPGGGNTTVEGFRFVMQWDNNTYGGWRWGEVVGGALYQRLRVYRINSIGTLTNVREIVTTGGTNTLIRVGEWCNFTSGAGSKYLLQVTTQTIAAVDTLVVTAFDGTSWTTPAITGLTAGTLGITSHRNRLWFYADPTKPLSAWYLPVGAVAGAVVEFNLGVFATKGGSICAIRTWTIDGGVGGTDDLCAFLTTKGQLLLYQGTDPSASATWALVGVFDLSPPASPVGSVIYSNDTPPPAGDVTNFIRDTFAVKYGADLLLMLADGLSTASGVLRPTDVVGDYSISSKIRSLLATLAVSYSGLNEATTAFQWKIIYLPTRKQLLICVPTSSTSSTASGAVTATINACTIYAMNSETGAWCQFSGPNILDAIAVGNNMYYIDGGHNVYKYGVATSDNGTAISAECRQAYNYFNSPANKLLTLMQPQLRANATFLMSADMDADFISQTLTATPTYTVSGDTPVQPWLTVTRYGRAFAPHIATATTSGICTWYATNLLYRNAGLI